MIGVIVIVIVVETALVSVSSRVGDGAAATESVTVSRSIINAEMTINWSKK